MLHYLKVLYIICAQWPQREPKNSKVVYVTWNRGIPGLEQRGPTKRYKIKTEKGRARAAMLLSGLAQETNGDGLYNVSGKHQGVRDDQRGETHERIESVEESPVCFLGTG